MKALISPLNLPSANLQATVVTELDNYRRLHLTQALKDSVLKVDLKQINAELDGHAPAPDLSLLAGKGIRGELIFPVPVLLRENPRLLGYYRLLLGFSQKEFYNKGKLGRFNLMEEKGVIPVKLDPELPALCSGFAARASEFLRLVGIERVSATLLEELTLLTLGPQLRGSYNTQIGQLANNAVFQIIESIVGHAVQRKTVSSLEILNASGRLVDIRFSADPDISIVEAASKTSRRNVVAIEIKGGTDQSNIWNRLGEAEKSHQSAKQRGFVEFWTICNVGSLDPAKAREKSPTTHQFFSLQELMDDQSAAFENFRDRLISMIGIRAS